MNKKMQEKVGHQHKASYDTTLAFGISNVLQTLRLGKVSKMDIGNKKEVDKKQLECSRDNHNIKAAVASDKQISIGASKYEEKLSVAATKRKTQRHNSGYDTTLAFGVSDVLSVIRSNTANKQEKKLDSPIKESQYNGSKTGKKVSTLVLTQETINRCDLVKEASSFNNFLNIQNISLNKELKLSPANELERVGRNLELDLLKMIDLFKNRTQESIVLVTDDRDEFELGFKGVKDRVHVLKVSKMQLRNGFNIIQKHPSFGRGTIYVFFCGIHDLLVESILSDCQLHQCPSPQTVFSLPLDTSDFSFLIRVAIDLEFSVLHSTSNDIVLFSGLIPVEIEGFNQFISKSRPCYVSHPSLNLPKIDYFSYKNFLLTIECYNEFTKYHAQKLRFIPWDLQEPFLSSNSVSSQFQRCFLIEKMSPNGYHILKDDYIMRIDKVKVLCKKTLPPEVSRKEISCMPKPLEPVSSTSSFDVNESNKNAAVEGNLLNTIPFNNYQQCKKYSPNQLRRFDPVLAFDLLVMREIVCSRQNLNNIVLISDERDDFDITLNGFDARIKVFKSNGIQMKNAIDFVKKHSCFGKGTIFIVCCGIHDFLNAIMLDDCVRQRCPIPQTVFTLSPNVIDDNFLIKTAMALNFEILRSTANDIVLFCGIIPVDIGKYNMYTCMNRHCLAIHPALNLPVLDNFVYKSFIAAIESFNDFTKRHAQCLGFTPWDLEVPFFDYSRGSATSESNFMFQKMSINGFLISPQENQNRHYAVKSLCQNLLPPVSSVIKGLEKGCVALSNVTKEVKEPLSVNKALQKYSDSQLESVKYIYQNDINDIVISMKGRTQNNIVIVTDERDNFDTSLTGYDRLVSVLKVPGIKFSSALTSIKNHPSFGIGTIFIFSFGTHDLLQSIPLVECLNSKCINPTTVLRLPFANNDNHILIQQALQINRNIIISTKNDIVLFCGILPVNINTYNTCMLNARTCVASHFVGPLPPVDPILNICYENSINWYNNFTKYHSQTLGFEPWDLEVPYFSKIRSVLHINGFHLCESEDIERAKEAKKLCNMLFQKLSKDDKSVQQNNQAASNLIRTVAMTDAPVSLDCNVTSAKTMQIFPIKSVVPPDSNKNGSITSDGGVMPAFKILAGIPGISDGPAAKSIQVDTFRETSVFDSKIVTKYSKIVFIADKQYRPILEHFKNPNVILMADEHLQLNDLEAYLYASMKNLPREKTLYLIVTGIHTFSKAASANLCLLNSCKSPLPALASVTLDKLCNSAKECEKKLLTIITNIKHNLPIQSNIAILPPLPLQLISMNFSHTNMHTVINLFPEYVIANSEFVVGKYYPMWMDSISNLSLSSFFNCNLQHLSFQRIITDPYKKLEMIENFDANSSNANIIWKRLVADILDIVMENCEQLDCPSNDKLQFDHLVFIVSHSFLKLLPDISAYAKSVSFWFFDDIVESQNIFIKIGKLNKMALKNVLFIFLSDISMIAFDELYPQCIWNSCEYKLSFFRLQTNSSESKTAEKKLYNSLSSIKIIISEIKMLSSFMSKFIMAPFTPRIYTLVSDTKDEEQHVEMHECMKKKNCTSFLYGTTTAEWADLLLSFSIKWKLLSKQILCKDGDSLNEFMNVINAKVENLAMITWRILLQTSFDDNYTAFSLWQSCILSIIEVALEKSISYQTTVNRVDPSKNLLLQKRQGSFLFHSHSAMTQQQNLTINKESISFNDSQNIAKDKNSKMDHHISSFSGNCSPSKITDKVTYFSSFLGVYEGCDNEVEKSLTKKNNHLTQSKKCVSRKEDNVTVVGNSCTGKASFEENLPILPTIVNISKSATPKSFERILPLNSIVNKTSGFSSTSLEIPLMTNFGQSPPCSSSDICSQKSNTTLQEDMGMMLDSLMQTRCSQSNLRPNTPKNENMKIGPVSTIQEQNASIESLPIVSVISKGLVHSNPPAPRAYRPQHLVPIVCKEIGVDKHDVISKTGLSNFNISRKCSASLENEASISSCTNQSTSKKLKSRSISPHKRTSSLINVHIKFECVSPSTNKEYTPSSLTVKKEIVSPEHGNLKPIAFDNSFQSSKSFTPERRTPTEKSIVERSSVKNKHHTITETNNPWTGSHYPKETFPDLHSAFQNIEPKSPVSKSVNNTLTQKNLATELMVSETSTVSQCKTLKLPAISADSKKSVCPSEHLEKAVSEIKKEKSKSRSATPKKSSLFNEAIKYSDSVQSEILIPEKKRRKFIGEYSDFISSISAEDSSRLRLSSSSKKHTHSSDKAIDKSSGDSDSNSRLRAKGKKRRRSRSRSSNYKKKSRSRSPSYHKESRSSNYQKKSRSRSPSYHKDSRSTKHHKKSKSRSPSYHKESRSTKHHKKSKSRSPSYHTESRSTKHHKKSKSRSPSYHKESRSTKHHKKSKSRSPSYHKESRSTKHHKKSKSRSPSYHKESRSTKHHKKTKSRSPSYHKESRSTKHHKKSRSGSSSYHKKEKDSKKSKSKSKHSKKSRPKSPSPTSKEHAFAESFLAPFCVKSGTIEKDLSNQHLQTALRKQIGEIHFGEYTKDLAKMRSTFEAESLTYEKSPEKHPNFKMIYQIFAGMNSAHGNVDKQHVKKLWKIFWESQYEDIKKEDWKNRQLQLIKEYEQKVPSKSSFLLSKSSTSENKTATYSVDKALILLETLCHKVSFMSPAVSALVKTCQNMGTSTKGVYDIINEPENHILINLVLEKFVNICATTSDEDKYLYKMAIDWIPKLLKEAENAIMMNVDELPIDLNAMARVSAGKDPQFMLDLIKTALQYEGISNPSVKLVNEIVHRICSIICRA